jgi:hypothetical protein
MEAKLEEGRAHISDYVQPDKRVGPDQLRAGKRSRGAENEEPAEHICKSPRLLENRQYSVPLLWSYH